MNLDTTKKTLGHFLKKAVPNYDFLSMKDTLNKICAFIAEDKYNLCLYGHTGSGKTTTLKALHETFQHINGRLYKNPLSVTDLARRYAESGFAGIDMLSGEIIIDPANKAVLKRYELFIDDVGSEMSKITNYGNTIDVSEYAILERYNNFKNGTFTMLTTNLDETSFNQYFGDTVLSRMREQYKFVKFPDVDFRKRS